MRSKMTLLFAILMIALPLCGCSKLSAAFEEGWHFAEGEKFYRANSYQQAEREYKISLDRQQSTGIWGAKAKCLVRLGQIYASQGKDSDASATLASALDIFNKNADSNQIKHNRDKVRSFWIIGLKEQAKLLRKQNQDKQANDLEEQAKNLAAHAHSQD